MDPFDISDAKETKRVFSLSLHIRLDIDRLMQKVLRESNLDLPFDAKKKGGISFNLF